MSENKNVARMRYIAEICVPQLEARDTVAYVVLQLTGNVCAWSVFQHLTRCGVRGAREEQLRELTVMQNTKRGCALLVNGWANVMFADYGDGRAQVLSARALKGCRWNFGKEIVSRSKQGFIAGGSRLICVKNDILIENLPNVFFAHPSRPGASLPPSIKLLAYDAGLRIT